MKKLWISFQVFLSLVLVFPISSEGQEGFIFPVHRVSLYEAHIGDLETDTCLLDSYGRLPGNIRQFYLETRQIFTDSIETDFTDPRILKSARRNHIDLIGGPMQGNLSENGITIWLRPASRVSLMLKLTTADESFMKFIPVRSIISGEVKKLVLEDLDPGTSYYYEILRKKRTIATGRFTTAPVPDDEAVFRLAFGSCFHKIGLHNPNLVNQVLKRDPQMMVLIGDIAVDDRENKINMHRSDYLLRDVSVPWQKLTSSIPVYSSWDDHDYLNNDLGGVPEPFTIKDREKLLTVWNQNWNNPDTDFDGIYFSTRIGPVELIMLDTRSCRNVEKRGEYMSFLGTEQQKWLKETLKASTAPFKLITTGTMWSDYITPGKDSWGTWDTLAREEIFRLIENERIPGVILLSGDRHGARAFSIPRQEGFAFYEFEVATLGGVPGPEAMASDTSNQLFGYNGSGLIAFGEFTFDTRKANPQAVFRLIDESGKILEEHHLFYEQLTPPSGEGSKNELE